LPFHFAINNKTIIRKITIFTDKTAVAKDR